MLTFKDNIRLKIIQIRVNQGVKYTALFNIDPLHASDLLSKLDGKRVVIKNIRTGKYNYRVDIVECILPVLPQELSEWREE